MPAEQRFRLDPSEVFNAIAREYSWPDWMPDPVRQSGAADPAHAGEYELRPGERAAVEASDGGLSFLLTGQPAMPMIPTGDGYHLSAVNATVRFQDDRLVLTQAGQRLEARRSAPG